MLVARAANCVRTLLHGSDDVHGRPREHPFNADKLKNMRSVTKSVASLAVGIATDRRLIGGVNQWIFNFFPEFGIFFGIAATLTAQPKNCTPPECSARLRCRFSRVVDQDQGILLRPLDTLMTKMPASGRALMYTHLLLPTEGSALSERAIDHGVALAKAVHASVTGVTVSEPLSALSIEAVAIADVSEDYRKEIATAAEKHLDVVRKAAAAAGVVCDVVHVEGPHPYQGIIDTAKAKGCDVIVMASHGRRGLSAIVLGSETVKVLTHSTTPVVVCR